MPAFEAMRAAMVDSQLRTVGVTDPRVVAAFSAIPRERFVPDARRLLAYADDAIELAPGRFLSTPMAFGRLLAAARIQADERVLLVGAASGYGAAVIAQLAREVVALDDNESLRTPAAAELAGVTFVSGPLGQGWSAGAPYDVVFVDGAIETVPEALIAQLRDGGRLAAVVVQRGVSRIAVGVKAGSGFGMTELAEVATPRLPGFEAPAGFRF